VYREVSGKIIAARSVNTKPAKMIVYLARLVKTVSRTKLILILKL
jgi:hypothetical protein